MCKKNELHFWEMPLKWFIVTKWRFSLKNKTYFNLQYMRWVAIYCTAILRSDDMPRPRLKLHTYYHRYLFWIVNYVVTAKKMYIDVVWMYFFSIVINTWLAQLAQCFILCSLKSDIHALLHTVLLLLKGKFAILYVAIEFTRLLTTMPVFREL